MDKSIIRRFEKKRGSILDRFREKHPEEYKDIVSALVEAISDDSELCMDAKKILELKPDTTQGAIVYIIGAKEDTWSWTPTYWATYCEYGSCCACDTLQHIRTENEDNPPTEAQAKDYLTLALHAAQRMERLFREEV